jgi:hypothetical protein
MIHPFVSKCIPDLIKLYGVYKLIIWLHAQKEASAKKLACGQWEACIRSDYMHDPHEHHHHVETKQQ